MKKVTTFLFVLFQIGLMAQVNFVVIISDDMGWTGSSHQMDSSISDSQSDYYQTPQLEALAAQGMTFSQGYAPAAKCSPSRNSILTGRSTARTGFTNTGSSVASGKLLIEPASAPNLNGPDTLISEWLKMTNLNYTTAHYGKWHLGNAPTDRPVNNGFDYSDGSTSNNTGNNGGGTAQVDPKKIFTVTDSSKAFIQRAVTANKPFYLQVSHYAVHSDIEAQQATIDIYNDPMQRPPGTRHNHVTYGAMTEDTDTGIGELIAFIDSFGIDTNTYIVFMSDNGAQLNFSDNSPLLRGKSFIFEGGIRVPFIVRGPNIAAGIYNTEPVVAYDLYQTFAELSTGTAALPSNMDGASLAPLFSGAPLNRGVPIYFHSPHYESTGNSAKRPRSAAVMGKYKVLADYEMGTIELFDLDADIGESTDISASEDSIYREMRFYLRDYLKSVNAIMPALDSSHAMFTGAPPDVDADGLDDAWEFRELLSYTYTATDDPDNDGLDNLTEMNNGTDPYRPQLSLALKVFLSGAYDGALMRDDLRQNGLIPLKTPYFSFGFGGNGEETVDTSIFLVSGNDAIVDWVFLELRDKMDNTKVLHTRSALLQRDGDVVDLDGISVVEFEAQADDYFVVIRHRNHLGAMTSSPITLSGIQTSLDFSTQPTFGTDAQKDLGSGVFGLWAGDADLDGKVKLLGGSSDFGFIENAVLTNSLNIDSEASFPLLGYELGDLNLDGKVIFQGSESDIPLLENTVLTHPINVLFDATVEINEQVP